MFRFNEQSVFSKAAIMAILPGLFALALPAQTFATSVADLSYIDLHPNTADNQPFSRAYAVAAGQVAGTYVSNQSGAAVRAAYWSSPSAASFVKLASTPSEAWAISPTLQAGYQTPGGVYWAGSEASFKGVNVAGAEFTYLTSVGGEWAGGYSVPGVGNDARIWHLTPDGSDAPISLSPQGSVASSVHALYGAGGAGQPGVQVGEVDGSAALWSGSAASYVNLQPTGNPDYTHSVAYAVYGGQQGGEVQINATPQDYVFHAGIWNGTAGSFTDLNPNIDDPVLGLVTDSVIRGMALGVQVGFINFDDDPSFYDKQHAFVWFGSNSDYLDLQNFLPSNFSSSRAFGVDRIGNQVWVVGDAYNENNNRQEAMLWSFTVPEPGSVLLFVVGGLAFFVQPQRACRLTMSRKN